MQDYKVVYRTLTAGATVSGGAQNVSEFQDYLNKTYLGQGYKILQVSLLRVLADAQNPYMTEWAYHLVKE